MVDTVLAARRREAIPHFITLEQPLCRVGWWTATWTSTRGAMTGVPFTSCAPRNVRLTLSPGSRELYVNFDARRARALVVLQNLTGFTARAPAHTGFKGSESLQLTSSA